MVLQVEAKVRSNRYNIYRTSVFVPVDTRWKLRPVAGSDWNSRLEARREGEHEDGKPGATHPPPSEPGEYDPALPVMSRNEKR